MLSLVCICDRWCCEIEPGVFVHEDDLTECAPPESLAVVYLDEVL